MLDQGDALTLADPTAVDLADGDAADVIAVFERDHLHLQGTVRVGFRGGDVGQNRVEQRVEVDGRDGHVRRRDAVLAGGVKQREFQRHIVGPEFHEEVEDEVVNFGDPGVRPVDFVDHDDRLEAVLECLAQDEPRLRQWTFGRVHQKEHPVGHLEDALDFAAEVRVPGGVHQVDFHVPEADGDVLREDRDAALALEVVRVYDQAVLPPLELVELLGPKLARLAEHLIDHRGLAVVNVGDDGHIPNVVPTHWLP